MLDNTTSGQVLADGVLCARFMSQQISYIFICFSKTFEKLFSSRRLEFRIYRGKPVSLKLCSDTNCNNLQFSQIFKTF